MKKVLAWSFGLFVAFVSALAFPTAIPLVTGPVDVGTMPSVLNTLISQINQYYGIGYIKIAPLTGSSYTMGTFQISELLAAPAGTISTMTATLPAGVLDGARACIFSTQTITTLTVSASAGQSINNAVTTLAANGRVCYTYGSSNTTWDRSQ